MFWSILFVVAQCEERNPQQIRNQKEEKEEKRRERRQSSPVQEVSLFGNQCRQVLKDLLQFNNVLFNAFGHFGSRRNVSVLSHQRRLRHIYAHFFSFFVQVSIFFNG
jgi:hypothetical protein